MLRHLYRFICTFLTKADCCRNIEIVLHPTAMNYVYICTHIDTHIYVCMHIYIYTYRYTYIYVYIYIYYCTWNDMIEKINERSSVQGVDCAGEDVRYGTEALVITRIHGVRVNVGQRRARANVR